MVASGCGVDGVLPDEEMKGVRCWIRGSNEDRRGKIAVPRIVELNQDWFARRG